MTPAATAVQQAVVSMTTVNLRAEIIEEYLISHNQPSETNSAFTNSATQGEDTCNRRNKNIQTATMIQL